MNDKIKELLSVLDMTEDEQWIFLCNRGCLSAPSGLLGFTERWDLWRWKAYFRENLEDKFQSTLADLAFRLRDEVGENMISGIQELHIKLSPGIPRKVFDKWWRFNSKPIHWIIATLIAKELAK